MYQRGGMCTDAFCTVELFFRWLLPFEVWQKFSLPFLESYKWSEGTMRTRYHVHQISKSPPIEIGEYQKPWLFAWSEKCISLCLCDSNQLHPPLSKAFPLMLWLPFEFFGSIQNVCRESCDAFNVHFPWHAIGSWTKFSHFLNSFIWNAKSNTTSCIIFATL